MYYLCGVGIIAMRFIQSPAITDYYNIISNLLKSNVRGYEKTHDNIHSLEFFQKKLPVNNV